MPQPRGFIALTSVLIICAVLMLIATGGSFAGFYGRANSLIFEYKDRSAELAYACVRQTLLALANDPADYATLGSATTTIGAASCYTGAITKTGTAPNDSYVFRTRAYYQGAYTSYSATAAVSTLTLQSLSEVPTF